MASTNITSPKYNQHTSISNQAKIQAWGELYIFDLPSDLRGALFENEITFLYRRSLASQPGVETSEEIWTEDLQWIKKIEMFKQAYRFEFFRCVLPQSFDRQSGLIFEEPLSELANLQHVDQIYVHRHWTLIIFGKENIAAMHLQTDLLKRKESEPIKNRLVILKDELKESVPMVEGKKVYLKSKKEKVVERLSRKSQRGVDKDPMNTDPMNEAGTEFLAAWENELERSELIFIGASKKQVSTFFPISSPSYNKLRAFPFAFGSPTIEELKRCYVKLTTAKLDLEAGPEI